MTLDDMHDLIQRGQAMKHDILTGPIELELDIEMQCIESLERCILLRKELHDERARFARLSQRAVGE